MLDTRGIAGAGLDVVCLPVTLPIGTVVQMMQPRSTDVPLPGELMFTVATPGWCSR